MDRGLHFLLNRKAPDDSSSSESSSREHTCRKVTDGLSTTLLTLANEPSLAYFRIQEHIRKSVPTLLEEQSNVNRYHSLIQGGCYDLDDSIEAVDNISRSTIHFCRINELLKSSMFAKLQLDYEREHNQTPVEIGVDALMLMNLNSPDCSLSDATSIDPITCDPSTSPESIGKKPDLLSSNQPSTSTSLNDKKPPTSMQSFRLNSLSSTVSTAAVQVREQTIGVLSRRALFTRSADVSSLCSPLDQKSPTGTENLDNQESHLMPK